MCFDLIAQQTVSFFVSIKHAQSLEFSLRKRIIINSDGSVSTVTSYIPTGTPLFYPNA